MIKKSLFLTVLVVILFININTFIADGDVMGVYWDTDSGQDIQPGETIIVNTEVLNTNNYKVSVSISIILNYTLIPENGSVIELKPCPNGTWNSELIETNFILRANEYKNVTLKIIAPPTAVNDEVYGLYMNFYVENFYVPKLNNSGIYVFAAIVNFTTYNNYSDDGIYNNIENPSIFEPDNDNQTTENKYNSHLNLKILIIIIIVIVAIIIYFLYYSRVLHKPNYKL